MPARCSASRSTPVYSGVRVTRTVPTNAPMLAFEGCSYSVSHTLAGQTVWVREHGDQILVVHVSAGGPVEVARHARTIRQSPGG
jgi:hypothetical protein